MKIAFIYSSSKLSGRLTKLFTGSYCYHVALVDEEKGLMYDMHLLPRKRVWPHYKEGEYVLVPTPVVVTREFMECVLATDDNTYGWKDYVLFSLRWVFHLVGKSTPNAKGVICSEFVYNVLKNNGWKTTFMEVPSPADLEGALNVRR